METKVTTKKTEAKKVSAKSKAVAAEPIAEPFAEVAEPAPVKKRVAKKAAPAVKTEAKPVKAKAKTIIADPFAELAEPTSPVKKRAAKTAAADARTAKKATAKPAEKAPSKPAKKAVRKNAKKSIVDVTADLAAAEPLAELSPVFKALADVTLPELDREDRARLLMQTPTRLYFYWSLRQNPWATLRGVFGDDPGSYSLVVKLIDKKHDREEIKPCEAEGNWWFDVEPDGSYQAEIGFYATNRPYFRILYSNIVETPRRSPSPRAATESEWTVSATKFAEVLDVAGFARDAFDVAVVGDDLAAAEIATHTAFAQVLGSADYDLKGITAEDIRFALMALASGLSLEEIRWRVSQALFAILQANAGNLAAGKALNALTQHFDIDEAEFSEEYTGSAVYGASLVNFPKTLKTRTLSPKDAQVYSPVSSHSLR